MTVSIPVRRGSLTIATCDIELAQLAYQLRRATGDAREQLLIDSDRWLDIRNELIEERRRIKQQGSRGLA